VSGSTGSGFPALLSRYNIDAIVEKSGPRLGRLTKRLWTTRSEHRNGWYARAFDATFLPPGSAGCTTIVHAHWPTIVYFRPSYASNNSSTSILHMAAPHARCPTNYSSLSFLLPLRMDLSSSTRLPHADSTSETAHSAQGLV